MAEYVSYADHAINVTSQTRSWTIHMRMHKGISTEMQDPRRNMIDKRSQSQLFDTHKRGVQVQQRLMHAIKECLRFQERRPAGPLSRRNGSSLWVFPRSAHPSINQQSRPSPRNEYKKRHDSTFKKALNWKYSCQALLTSAPPVSSIDDAIVFSLAVVALFVLVFRFVLAVVTNQLSMFSRLCLYSPECTRNSRWNRVVKIRFKKRKSRHTYL